MTDTSAEAVERFGPYAIDGGCDAYGAMEEDPHGDWVRYEDYQSQAARIAELERELKSVLDRESATHARHDAKVDKLEAEVARLRSLIETIAGDVCDSTKGEHVVMKQGNYRFCIYCGETMTSSKIKAAKKAVLARAALQDKPHE